MEKDKLKISSLKNSVYLLGKKGVQNTNRSSNHQIKQLCRNCYNAFK